MASITEQLSIWAGNFHARTSEAFERMELKDYIRLVVIIGGYCLLRPYIMKLGAKMQERAHERDSAEHGDIHPNELRGKVDIPGVDDSDDEDGESRPGEWGRNARLRQRKFIRQALELEEKRLQESLEEEEDKDIAEFLVD